MLKKAIRFEHSVNPKWIIYMCTAVQMKIIKARKTIWVERRAAEKPVQMLWSNFWTAWSRFDQFLVICGNNLVPRSHSAWRHGRSGYEIIVGIIFLLRRSFVFSLYCAFLQNSFRIQILRIHRRIICLSISRHVQVLVSVAVNCVGTHRLVETSVAWRSKAYS